MDSKISLLEKLTKLTGAMYLSNLKTMAQATIRTELHDIDPKKYTLFQWKDAAKYLTGNDVDLDTVKGIYEYLLTYQHEYFIKRE